MKDLCNYTPEDWVKSGYKFEYDANGYSVWHNGIFLQGAGVKLPREKKLHWRHARANITENKIQCVNTAIKHLKMKGDKDENL